MMFRTLLALLFSPLTGQAIDENRLADAIYRAEGGAKAKVPYGILSMKVRDHDHARQICLRTIRRALASWDGRQDFVSHLGRRYCPPESDPKGHARWIKNVRYLYRRPQVPLPPGPRPPS